MLKNMPAPRPASKRKISNMAKPVARLLASVQRAAHKKPRTRTRFFPKRSPSTPAGNCMPI